MKWWEICPRYTVSGKKQIAEESIWYDYTHVFKNVYKYLHMLVYTFKNSHGYLAEMVLGDEGRVKKEGTFNFYCILPIS